MPIDFNDSGREGGEEREKHHRLIASHMSPNQESYKPWLWIEPSTQVCALTRDESTTFRAWDDVQWTEPPSQGGLTLF